MAEAAARDEEEGVELNDAEPGDISAVRRVEKRVDEQCESAGVVREYRRHRADAAWFDDDPESIRTNVGKHANGEQPIDGVDAQQRSSAEGNDAGQHRKVKCVMPPCRSRIEGACCSVGGDDRDTGLLGSRGLCQHTSRMAHWRSGWRR